MQPHKNSRAVIISDDTAIWTGSERSNFSLMPPTSRKQIPPKINIVQWLFPLNRSSVIV